MIWQFTAVVKKHNDNSPFLIGDSEEGDKITTAKQKSWKQKIFRLVLFFNFEQKQKKIFLYAILNLKYSNKKLFERWKNDEMQIGQIKRDRYSKKYNIYRER